MFSRFANLGLKNICGFISPQDFDERSLRSGCIHASIHTINSTISFGTALVLVNQK